MNVQLSSHGIGRPALRGAGKPAFAEAAGIDGARSAAAARPPRHGGATRRNEFAAGQIRLNGRVTHAQRAIRFIDQALAGLQGLKTTLGGSIAGHAPARAELEARLAGVRAQWRQRHEATGGALGADLSFHDDGEAQRHFRIGALDLGTLRDERAEVLMIYPRGTGKASLALVVDGQSRGEREWARRLDHALAPAGIHVTLGDEHQLSCRMQESRWNELRDHLMIQGGGHRFPAGRPARVAATPAAEAIDPSTWQIADAAGQRAALRQAVHAIDHVQLVRDSLVRALEQAHGSIRGDSDMDGRDAAGLAASFAGALKQTGDFQRFAAIGAILRGLSEQRVRSVAG